MKYCRGIISQTRGDFRSCQESNSSEALQKGTMAGIDHLPLEVLAIVFEALAADNESSPWTLMHVSRPWRATALMTTSIWGRIILSPYHVVYSNHGWKTGWKSRTETCFNEGQVARALQRAGGTPLELKIIYTAGDNRISDTGCHELRKLINCIPRHRDNPRLRSLYIATNRGLSVYRINFARYDFVDLASITLDHDYPELITKVVTETRVLRSLHVSAPSLDRMTDCRWWGQLEHLVVDSLFPARNRDNLVSILSAATSLTSLNLIWGLFIPGMGEEISMPSLRRLKLHSIHDLMTFRCPKLTHLSVDAPHRVDGPVDRSIRLPELIELSLHSRGGNILRAFDVPSLCNLDLVGGRRTPGEPTNVLGYTWFGPTSTTGSIPEASSIEPRIFSLRRTEVDSEVLARTLAARTVLEEFSAIQVELNGKFFDNLAPVKSETTGTILQETWRGDASTWRVDCKALKRLVIDFVPRGFRLDKVALEASAQTFLIARVQAGVPLERLAIRFSEREGWTEFVSTGATA